MTETEHGTEPADADASAPATDEMEAEFQRVMARIDGPGSNEEKAEALIGLTGRLIQGEAFQRAIQVALAGLEWVGDAPTVQRAQLLSALGFAYGRHGQVDESIAHCEQSVEIHRALGDQSGEAMALSNFATLYHSWQKETEALSRFEASLKIWRALGNQAGEVATLTSMASLYGELGKHDEALSCFETSLEIYRAGGKRSGEAAMLNNMASLYGSQKKWDKALSLYEASLDIWREVGEKDLEDMVLNNIAGILHQMGAVG